MSEIHPTRRADEPPAHNGAPLSGWPVIITAEEAVQLRRAVLVAAQIFPSCGLGPDDPVALMERIGQLVDRQRGQIDRARDVINSQRTARRRLQIALDEAQRESEAARAELQRVCAYQICCLTERQRSILELAAEGRQDKAIARELGISPHSVKKHMCAVLRKLGAKTRRDAAAVLRAAAP